MKSPITDITIAILALVVVAAIGIHNIGKSKLSPLEIKLPRAMFVGTDVDVVCQRAPHTAQQHRAVERFLDEIERAGLQGADGHRDVREGR